MRARYAGSPYGSRTRSLHEVVDEEHGAGGILGNLIMLLEQMLLVQWIKAIHNIKPSLMEEVLFIKDGPLAFFGPTANLYKPMRALMRYLLEPKRRGGVASSRRGREERRIRGARSGHSGPDGEGHAADTA